MLIMTGEEAKRPRRREGKREEEEKRRGEGKKRDIIERWRATGIVA
jgi:hypothetical protein